ncbi:MAG: MlaE family ABC transporter permease [Candidatus Binataceae bacterium]
MPEPPGDITASAAEDSEGALEAAERSADESAVLFEREDDTLVVSLIGTWSLDLGLPSTSELEGELASTPPPRRVAFETGELGAWDSALVTFVARSGELCRAKGIAVDRAGLPPGLVRLLELAESVPEKKDAHAGQVRRPLLERIGSVSIGYGQSIGEFLAFLGELSLAFANMLRGVARFRRSDLALTIQQCGADALGIVALISFLVGAILAFMGAVQLSKFGASIYVANLVGIGMVRDMGAMMTAIIMSGRTGAAFAAQLGTMKVTQEIDALVTMGISPMEFLVLPRVIALVLMMPLLAAYADLVGILGGAAVGTGILHLSFITYMHTTMDSVSIHGMLGGLFKAGTYGFLIAISGCMRGFQCGNSSSAVGDAATAAVVTSIVEVVVACGIFAWVFNILGI